MFSVSILFENTSEMGFKESNIIRTTTLFTFLRLCHRRKLFLNNEFMSSLSSGPNHYLSS